MRYSIVFPLIGLASAASVPAMDDTPPVNGTSPGLADVGNRLTPPYNASDVRMHDRGDVRKCETPCTICCVVSLVPCAFCWAICQLVENLKEDEWKKRIWNECTGQNENCDLIGKDWSVLKRDEPSITVNPSELDSAQCENKGGIQLDEATKEQALGFVNRTIQHIKEVDQKFDTFAHEMMERIKDINVVGTMDKRAKVKGENVQAMDAANLLTKEKIAAAVEEGMKKAKEYF